MKLGDLLNKFRRRSPHDDEDGRSADSIDERAAVAEAESYSAFVPSQQDDRPPH